METEVVPVKKSPLNRETLRQIQIETDCILDTPTTLDLSIPSST
jgi:hypothetical protein